MSYADAAASGPKQSPEDASAPQLPEVINTETASISSLVDVDAPSVHTVPSDFLERDVQTETQAARREREKEEEEASKRAKAQAKAREAKQAAADKAEKARQKGRKADGWIISQFARASDGSLGALALVNVAGVVGLSAFLGYKGWGLYDRGRLSWEKVGLGVGILAGVGAVETILGRYVAKARKD